MILRGNYRKVAFAFYGISVNTWSKWVAIGNAYINGSQPQRGVSPEHGAMCVDLVRRLNQCEAQLEDRLIFDISSGSNEDKKWYLRHRHNARYNNNPRARFDDEAGTEYKIDAHELLTERLATLLARAHVDHEGDE